MAAIYPDHQVYVDLPNGLTVGIHIVTPVSSSDTITVPQLASSTANESSNQLRTETDVGATITDDADDQVTIVGTRGRRCIIATIHNTRVNAGWETDAY
jgi:hypothetical protein